MNFLLLLKGVLKCKIDYDANVKAATLHQFMIEKLTQHPGDRIAMVLVYNENQNILPVSLKILNVFRQK